MSSSIRVNPFLVDDSMFALYLLDIFKLSRGVYIRQRVYRRVIRGAFVIIEGV